MTTEIHLQPLATPFAPADDQVTVATPSCCCCCCCCLVTLTTATTLAAAEANFAARDNAGHRTIATILGLSAVPAGLFVAYEAAKVSASNNVILPLTVLVVSGLLVASLWVARAPFERSVPFAVLFVAIFGTTLVIEFFAALMTAFLIELLAPLGVWAGISIARSRAEGAAHKPPAQSAPHLLPPPRPLEVDDLAPPPPPQTEPPDDGGGPAQSPPSP